MRDAIIEKLKSGNYNFKIYELDYIRENEKFQITFVNYIKTLNCKWNETLFDVINYYIDFDKIIVNEIVLYNYLLNQIKYAPDNRSQFLENLQYLKNNEYKEYLLNLYNTELEKEEVISKILIEETDILYLLDNKMYKQLSYIKRVSNTYKYNIDLLTKINNEYPFETLSFPKFLFYLHDRIYLRKLNYLSIEDILIALGEKNLFARDIEILKIELYKKLKNEENLDNESFDCLLNDEHYYNMKNRFSCEEQKDLANMFLNKNSLLFYELLEDNQVNCNKIENIVLNNLTQTKLLAECGSDKIIFNKNIILNFIKYGFYEVVIDYYYEVDNEMLKDFIYNNLTKELRDNPLSFQKELESISTKSIIDKNILKIILQTGYVKEIFINDNKDYIDIIYDFISCNPQVKVDFSINSLNIIKKYFIKALNYDNLDLLYNIIVNNGLTNAFYELIYNYLYKDNLRDFLGNYLLDKVLKHDNILEYYLKNNIYTQEILDLIINEKQYDNLLNDKNYQLIKVNICNLYNVEVKKLDLLKEKYGVKILKYFNEEKFLDLLYMPTNNILKIISLFDCKDFTTTDLESIFDSIKQYEYSINNYDVFDLYNIIINTSDPKIIQRYCYELISYIDNKCYENIISKYDIKDIFNKVQLVIKSVLNVNKNEEYSNILHEIINYYILKKREEYRLTYKDKMYETLNVPFQYDKKNILNEGANYCIYNQNILFGDNEKFADKLKKELIKEEITNDINQLDMKILKKYSKRIIENNYEYFIKTYLDKFKDKLRKEYYIPEKKINSIDLILKLNFAKVEEILNNTTIYNCLLKVLQTKKIIIWPNFLKEYIQNSNSDLTYIDGAELNIINYFYTIYNKEFNNNINISISTLLKYMVSYTNVSSIYTQILGREDAELIKLNPGSLHAHLKTENNIRLIESCEWTLNNFSRKYLSVPSMNEIFEFNNKKVRVVIGNFTHPNNLTHGERTNSCMRIGGIGESLYSFALGNINGFHIVLYDAETNEYLTRATAFRNGNSIFINCLRYSLNYRKFSNYELAKILELSMQKEIEYTTNSKYPIDNVFIPDSYAITDINYYPVTLNVNSIKSNLKGFYTDISNKAVVLCTRNKEETYHKIILNKSTDKYLPARYDVMNSNNIYDAYNIINRIYNIKNLFILRENNPNETIDNLMQYLKPLNIDNGLIEAYFNYDFYVYIDNNLDIHEDIIGFDNRAYEELAYYKEKLTSKYKNYNLERKRIK